MEDVVRIGLPLGECVGLQHRQSWLRFPPNTDEEVHSSWARMVRLIDDLMWEVVVVISEIDSRCLTVFHIVPPLYIYI